MTETIDTVKARLAPKQVDLDGESYWMRKTESDEPRASWYRCDSR